MIPYDAVKYPPRLLGITLYSGVKLFSISTDSFFSGKSRMCPIDDRTKKDGPRYLPIVFALAGDSTITRLFFALDMRLSPINSR